MFWLGLVGLKYYLTLQGSVVCLVIINRMIYEMFNCVGPGYGCSLYADDWALWKRDYNAEYVKRQKSRFSC